MNEKDRSFLVRGSFVVLAISVLGVLAALLAGLFNPVVDNDRIFKILEPMSLQASGALISILSGLVAIRVMGDRSPPKEGDDK